MRHAERLAPLGSGLLSASNHGLKKDINETNEILSKIENGLTEEFDTSEFAKQFAMNKMHTSTLFTLYHDVIRNLKDAVESGEYSGMDIDPSTSITPDVVSAIMVEVIRDLARNKPYVGMMVKQFGRGKAKTVARELKRGL